jgi:hypothetical protein
MTRDIVRDALIGAAVLYVIVLLALAVLPA